MVKSTGDTSGGIGSVDIQGRVSLIDCMVFGETKADRTGTYLCLRAPYLFAIFVFGRRLKVASLDRF